MTIKDRIFQITNQFLSMEKQEMPNIQSDTKYADIGGQYKKDGIIKKKHHFDAKNHDNYGFLLLFSKAS